MNRVRLARQSLSMELSVEPHARSVAREHAPGAVGAVRTGREPDDQEPRARIPEPRDRTPPVFFVQIRLPLHARDLGAVGAQPRTALAGDHIARDGLKIRGHRGFGPAYNPRLFPDPHPDTPGGIVRRQRILSAGLVTALLFAAITPNVRAELTPGTPAPDFTGKHVWINSAPLSLQKELKGKV